jgi:hypothetical protein
MRIINEEFEKRFALRAGQNSRTRMLDDWNPSDGDCAPIISRASDELMLPCVLTREQIVNVIKGPIQAIDEYVRMKSNLTTFTTRSYEARHHSRCSRKMIKYLSGDDEHTYAVVEQMFSIRSHSVTEISKPYNLLVIHNYEQVCSHASQLPCVKKMTHVNNIHEVTSVIRAESVYPHNVAAWPAGHTLPSEYSNYLMVQIDPTEDETTLAAIPERVDGRSVDDDDDDDDDERKYDDDNE